jgi:hypothetical protein
MRDPEVLDVRRQLVLFIVIQVSRRVHSMDRWFNTSMGKQPDVETGMDL